MKGDGVGWVSKMWPRETHVSHSKEVLFMSMPFEDLKQASGLICF